MKKLYILAITLIVVATIWTVPTRVGTDVRATPRADQLATVEDPRPGRIDAYFASRNMPLAGTGQKMVQEADKNGIDWRLLPAIAVKESSGGLHMCRNNPFGWASCKIEFESVDEAIETVARNLGGNNPRTKAYYSGDTRAKLQSYNGTVEPAYPGRVMAIMEKI